MLRELEGIGLQSIGLEASTLRYIESLVLIHSADELELVEGWERESLGRVRDIKLDASLRVLTDIFPDHPWFTTRSGESAKQKLASLGMGGSSCAS